MLGFGSPVAMQVKFLECPAIKTDVTGDVIIFGASKIRQHG